MDTSSGLLFLSAFANLIADGAAGLASRLARRLALAAAALFKACLQARFVDCLNVLQRYQLLSFN